MIAPNGKQSNLTDSQYKLVRTPAFKEWFGDWENNPSKASKVVDENGEPLVVFHASNNDFNIFDEKYIGSANDRGFYGKGFYFTDNLIGVKQYGNVIKSYFLKVTNPVFTYDSPREFSKSIWIPKGAKNLIGQGLEPYEHNEWNFYLDDNFSEKVTKNIITNGRNGLIAESVGEYIVYEPNQIKLADGSNTTFDSNNNDIRFDKGGEIKIDGNIFKVTIYLGDHSYDRETDKETPMWFCRVIKMNGNDVDGILSEDNDLEGADIGAFDSRKKAKDFLLKYSEELNVILLDDYSIGVNVFSNNPDIQYKKGGMTNKGYVSYKDKYNTKYGYSKGESHDLEEISKDTGVSIKGLQQIYNKGIGAYKTNPSSVRPNVKSKEQWAMARVYSSVMGGKASKIDSNELKMERGGILQDKNSIRKYAENLLKDFDYKYTGYSESNYGNSMYFDVDGIKCRFSDHTLTNRDRMINEINFSINDVNSESTKFSNNQSLLKLKYRLGDKSISYGKISYLGRSGRYLDAFGYTDLKDSKMEQGGNIKNNNMSKHKDGLFVGKSHKEGGIPMVVKSTGQKIEVEGGESITNKTSMADDKIRTLTGTNCEIISQINTQNGNGVAMDCDSVVGKKYEYKDGGGVYGKDKIPNVNHKDIQGKQFTYDGGKFLIVDFQNKEGAWNKGARWRKTAKHHSCIIKLDDIKTNLDKSLFYEFNKPHYVYDDYWLQFNGNLCRFIDGTSAKLIDTLNYEIYKRKNNPNNYKTGGWILVNSNTERTIGEYKTESEARQMMYEYDGDSFVMKKSELEKEKLKKTYREPAPINPATYIGMKKGGQVNLFDGEEDLINKRISGLKIALKFASNEEKKLIQKRIKAFDIAKKMLIPNTKTLEDLLEEDRDLQSEIDIEKRKPKNEQSELTRLGLERGVVLKKIDEIEKLNTNNVSDIKSMELYVSPMRERNLDKYGEDTNQCISCGKLMKDSDRKYVCMGTDWEAYNTNEFEERDGINYFVGTDTEIQGFFPIGNDCAKKMKGFTFERENKIDTGGIDNLELLKNKIRNISKKMEYDGESGYGGYVIYLDKDKIQISTYTNLSPYSAQASDEVKVVSFNAPNKTMIIFSTNVFERFEDNNSFEKYGGIKYIYEPLTNKIASEILEKIKEFTFERDNKFNTGGRVYNFSDYSNDALSDMIINLSRYENNEEYIKIVKEELKKRRSKNKGINQKMDNGGSISKVVQIAENISLEKIKEDWVNINKSEYFTYDMGSLFAFEVINNNKTINVVSNIYADLFNMNLESIEKKLNLNYSYKIYKLIEKYEKGQAKTLPEKYLYDYSRKGETHSLKTYYGLTYYFYKIIPLIKTDKVEEIKEMATGGSISDINKIIAEILKAISENKKIITGRLIFTSYFNNSSKKMEYRMNDDYRVDKWKEYKNEKEYTKAVMQRVNYYIKRGFSNVIEIK